MTLPVLFTMISNHFASLYGHALSWLVLLLVIVVGAFIRHTMITAKKWPLIPAFGGLAVLMAMTAPRSSSVLATTGPKSDYPKPTPFSKRAATPATRRIRPMIFSRSRRTE